MRHHKQHTRFARRLGHLGLHCRPLGIELRQQLVGVGYATRLAPHHLHFFLHLGPVVSCRHQRNPHPGLANLVNHHRRARISGANHGIRLEREQTLSGELTHITHLGGFLRRFGEQAGGVRTHQHALGIEQIDHLGQRAAERDQPLGRRSLRRCPCGYSHSCQPCAELLQAGTAAHIY